MKLIWNPLVYVWEGRLPRRTECSLNGKHNVSLTNKLDSASIVGRETVNGVAFSSRPGRRRVMLLRIANGVAVTVETAYKVTGYKVKSLIK